MAITLVFAGCDDSAPPQDELEWEFRAGGTGDDFARAIAVGPNGGVVATGTIEGKAVFGAGERNETTLFSRGGNDAFVAKYNSDGTLEWARSAGGREDDRGNGIAVAQDGSVIVTGSFRGVATFGPGQEDEIVITSSGGDEMFLAKFAPDGVLLWVRAAGGVDHDVGNDVAIAKGGDIFVAGEFQSQATFGRGDPTQTELSFFGVVDIFVARYDASGSLEWVRRAGGQGGDTATAIAVSADGGAIVTGEFRQRAVFGENESNETTLRAVAGSDVFVAKLSAKGKLTWVKRAGNTSEEEISDDVGWDVAVAPGGAIFVVGEFGQHFTFGGGESAETELTAVGLKNIFVAKLAADGTLLWARQSFGPILDVGTGVAAAPDGGAVITGRFNRSTRLGGGGRVDMSLESVGLYDVITARYDRDGMLLWTERAGGYTADDFGYGVAILPDGSVFVAGAFGDRVYFGDDPWDQPWLQSAGKRDIFVVKLPP